jgi:CPA1 family monovalent cation:H+ antiporter
MDAIIVKTLDLLIAAIAVGFLARRLRLPYTAGLVIAGIGIALSHTGFSFTLTHDFIFEVILPPLLFEAAIAIHWDELKRDAPAVLLLAIPGTMIAAAAMAGGLIWCLNWPVTPAVLFGILIAATDPVAVIALFRDNNVQGRPKLLVEAESLFNDGVAAVLFALALEWANGVTLPPFEALQTLTVTAGGGIVIGAITGMTAIAVSGRADDHLIEGTLTTICAYGSFLLAERCHVSGVLATVTAGLLMGNLGLLGETGPISERGRAFVGDLWSFIAFIANSIVFLMIGLTIATAHYDALGAGAIAAIIALGLLSRGLTVYPLCLVLSRSLWAVPMAARHLLWWGGLRGALGLALALSLPESLPWRGEIVIATFATVAFSVIAQGLTMPRLLRALGPRL